MVRIKIRDWELHFERDRTKQWKHLLWVPVPNKQGKGYKKIMLQKNGLEIFACWIAIVQAASKCDPRGDLSKYNIEDLSLLTMINEKKLNTAIVFLSQSLDWVEVIENKKQNLDVNVKNLDQHGMSTSFDSSIQFNSIQFNSINSSLIKSIEEKIKHHDFVYLTIKQYESLCEKYGKEETESAIKFLDQYLSNNKKKRKEYEDHNKALQNWVFTAVKEKKAKEAKLPQERKPVYYKQEKLKPEDIANPEEVRKLLENTTKKLKAV